jgi:phosphonate transport system permease protein
MVVLVVVAVALYGSGLGRRRLVNRGGWTVFARFWTAALHPDLSGASVERTVRAAGTTLSYAVLGTALSLLIGAVLGVALSRRSFSRSLHGTHSSWGRTAARVALTIPRGIHEAVWALILLNVIGRDPIVAVLAIAIPYGAITAKVYSDILDETVARQQRTLRAAGATRLSALLYATLPSSASELTSYGFYRFECAVRSAVVLGMVGTGGLGFLLSQSFQGLAYGEMWTSLYALMIIGAVAEMSSAGVRRRSGLGRPGVSQRRLAAGAVALVAWSAWYTGPRVSLLWSPTTATRIGRWLSDSFPPQLARGGWSALYRATVATVHMSILAMVIAVAVSVPLAFASARSARRASPGRRVGATIARVVALAMRSIPPSVWALLALFVLFPGVVPGAVAVGLYSGGVLSRLFAEVLENSPTAPHSALMDGGATRLTATAYATVPVIAPRWAAFTLYRLEVAAREAAVVGVVGAAGLGRLLTEQTAGFAYPKMMTTLLALIAVTLLIDQASSLIRRHLRTGD